MHVVGVHDALVRHDVAVHGVEGMDHTAKRSDAEALDPADSEVELVLCLAPLLGTDEPAGLGHRSAQEANIRAGEAA